MRSCYKLLLSALLLPLSSIAQTNYKPGYVVTTKGDTLKGFINIKEWSVTPKKISFKSSANGNDARDFGVSAITAFAATNLETYQRYVGLVNTDPTNISSLTNGRNTDTKTDSIFLKVIQKGANITLLEYADDLKNHYFVTDTRDNQPVELVYRIYKNDGKTINENGYMQQLLVLSDKYQGNDALKTRIEKTDYNFTDLVEIARKINNSDEKDDAPVTGKKKGTFFFASLGLNISKISSDNALFNAFNASVNTPGITDKKSTPTSLFPRIAAGINVLANPNTGRLIFRAELAYTANKYKGSALTNGATENYALNQNTFSVIPQILYNFYNTDDLKIYGAAGASLNISSYSNKLTINTNGTILNGTAIPAVQSTWTSFPFHLGAVINKKIDISVAYIPNASFTNSDSYYIQVSAIQAGINYTFY